MQDQKVQNLEYLKRGDTLWHIGRLIINMKPAQGK